jgi:hypothetical protein
LIQEAKGFGVDWGMNRSKGRVEARGRAKGNKTKINIGAKTMSEDLRRWLCCTMKWEFGGKRWAKCVGPTW